MDKLSTNWSICVVSHSPDLPNCGELSNALLYGDEVMWLPTEFPTLFNFTIFYRRESETKFTHNGHEIYSRIDQYMDFIKSLIGLEVPLFLPASYQERDDLMVRPDSMELESAGRAFLDTIELFINKYNLDMTGGDPEVLAHLQSAQACFIDPKSPYALQPIPHWDAHREAQRLMNALTRVLLPDVSALPIQEVIKVRENVKDELDPMRAELLRLTEVLRQMVKDEKSADEVTREAENLIKTRVEPVVREAARHTEEIMKSRFRQFFQKALTFFGLTGLGLLNPIFLKDAAQKGIEAAAEGVSALSKVDANTATARFVLEVRRNLPGKAA